MIWILLLFILLNFTESEIIRQCNCKKYENCLNAEEEPSVKKCLKTCDSIYPSSNVVPCLTSFTDEMEELKDCPYSAKNGIKGCSNRNRNILRRRSVGEFRDFMIHAMEVNLKDFDESRRFKNQKAAKQAECVFECIYPGRNSCTQKLECDLFLPPEEEYFYQFYRFMYKCLSRLFVTDSSLIQRDNKTRKRH
ncbi:unnamed protein product [Caenorhabditis angaria]|uniref:DUF19 domain-containing protein n=1 Tax=Caenorhabditis angaria TaxID=860376 RepID=A0A9P1IAF8_9PELO|nr:unnamed protein product [Caenorhabditis angaria]